MRANIRPLPLVIITEPRRRKDYRILLALARASLIEILRSRTWYEVYT